MIAFSACPLSQPSEDLLGRGASPSFIDQDRETIVPWGRQDKASVTGPPLKAQSIHTFDTKEKDVGAIGDAGHFEAGVGGRAAMTFSDVATARE